MATPGADPSAGLPPPANIVPLPLPPGMTLPMFLSIQRSLITICITVSIALAIVCYDYLTLLRDELSLYSSWKVTGKQSPAFFAFIVLRYAGFLAVIPALWFTVLPTSYCQFSASISQAGVVLVVGSSGIIFCYRVYAIWQGNRIVTGVIALFYVVMIGSWIAAATQLRAINGPPAFLLSNCIPQPLPSWSPISVASSVAFDTLALVLGLIKLRGELHTRSQVSKQIHTDNIFYFCIVTATNLATLVVQALPVGPKYDLVKPAVLPFSTAVTYAMGARVFLNLRLFHKRQQRQADGLPTVSSSSQGQRSGVTSSTSGGRMPINARAYSAQPMPVRVEPKPEYPDTDDERDSQEGKHVALKDFQSRS